MEHLKVPQPVNFMKVLAMPKFRGILIYEKYDIILRDYIAKHVSMINRERIFTFLNFAFEKFNALGIGASRYVTKIT
jgi:hypothetical protein